MVEAGFMDWCGPDFYRRDSQFNAQLSHLGSMISQTVRTIPGEKYLLRFSLLCPTAAQVTVDATLGNDTFHGVVPANRPGVWLDFATVITATSSTSILRFKNVDLAGTGPFLDSISLEGVPACSPAPAGLVGRWPGDGNGNDVVNNNHVVAEAGAGYGPGYINQGFLTGEKWFRAARNPALEPATVTVVAWVNATNLPGFYYVVSKSYISPRSSYGLYSGSGGGHEIGF